MTGSELDVMSGLISQVQRLNTCVDDANRDAESARKDRDEVIRKFGEVCRVFNDMPKYDFEAMKPSACKDFLIDLNRRLTECVKANDVHFVSGGAR